MAKRLVRIAGFINRARAAEWSGDLAFEQRVQKRSGLLPAALCLASSPRLALQGAEARVSSWWQTHHLSEMLDVGVGAALFVALLDVGLPPGLAAGLVAGLAGGAVAAAAGIVMVGLRAGLVAGVVTSVIAGSFAGLRDGLDGGISPGLNSPNSILATILITLVAVRAIARFRSQLDGHESVSQRT